MTNLSNENTKNPTLSSVRLDQLLYPIATELGLEISYISDEYIFEITDKRTGNFKVIFGKHLGLNTDTANVLASDKSATSSLLTKRNIPNVDHFLLYSPEHCSDYTDAKNIETIKKTFGLSDEIVLKPNNGSRGIDVAKFTDLETAIQYASNLLKTYPSVAVSPLFKAVTEYRCFMYKNQLRFVYKKQTPSNDWRFNLSQGGISKLLDKNDPIIAKLSQIAVDTVKALQINFATVDILESPEGDLKVLEVNSCVSSKIFLQQHPEYTKNISDIYTEILKDLFNL